MSEMRNLNDLSDVSVWKARAAAWELLAFSLRYPKRDLALAVRSGEWADAALEIAEVLGLALDDGFGEGIAAAEGIPGICSDAIDAAENEAADVLFHVLRTEATHLFVGAPDPAVSPYEGVWRAEDDGVDALMFVNPHSMAVERFCRSCGLGRPEGTNEPLDHVATECELLQYLSLAEAGLAKLPESAPDDAHAAFMRDHVDVWMPRFAAAVRSNARISFYRAVADFMTAFLNSFHCCADGE